jgi:hypothetical protein
MASRGMRLGSDIDNLAYASVEDLDSLLKKYILTKNVKMDTALRWAYQRAMNEVQRDLIKAKFKEYSENGSGLL